MVGMFLLNLISKAEQKEFETGLGTWYQKQKIVLGKFQKESTDIFSMGKIPETRLDRPKKEKMRSCSRERPVRKLI